MAINYTIDLDLESDTVSQNCETMWFGEGRIGNVKLRNRFIRAAAFEGMCPGHLVSDDLIDYHRKVSEGGIGMTTVAYAAVSRSGLSFPHQLWIRKEAIPGLQKLTTAVHHAGAKAAIQLGHCGLMAKRSVSAGCISPSGGFNLYGPTWPRKMDSTDIKNVISDFALAVTLAREAGFDAVEIHAGHGYLISQFLSPYTNRRQDEYGGTFENRCRFMKQVITGVLAAAGSDLAVLVKMNLRDGFKGGMEIDEAVEVAKILENLGVHALVLSGGFVSKAPMYVMRGSMPVRIMAHYMKEWWMKPFVRWFGNYLIKPEPFSELYFLEDALKIREKVTLPLVYVGGITSLQNIRTVFDHGFDFVQIARALVHDPAFINKLQTGEITRTGCDHTNYCIAVMYSGKMACEVKSEK
jgi:2,4-dienoyl-CoA reductase-like NADH-dependent reductase (Old Yellow Enzyme family)